MEGMMDKKAVPYLRRLVAGFPPWQPGFKPGSGHVGFCDGLKWRCQSTFHLLLHNHLHYHLRLAQLARSGHSANSLTNQIKKNDRQETEKKYQRKPGNYYPPTIFDM
jgi:hypothetical protein